jgi:hypothetical protein
MNYSNENQEMMRAVYASCQSRDIKIVENFLFDRKLPYMPKDLKEKTIFSEAVYLSSIYSYAKKIIEHLVFNYKIHEDNSIKHVPSKYIDSTIDNMFRTRNKLEIKFELIQELKSEYNKIKKAIKI